MSFIAKMDEQEIVKRKVAHIDLAASCQTMPFLCDERFHYEPLFSRLTLNSLERTFLGKKISAPFMISSMTGGSSEGKIINHNLAHACRQLKLPLALGSCRILLENPKALEDFNVRSILGPKQILMSNIGIAQVEELLKSQEVEKLDQLQAQLDADLLIVHINPLHEYTQRGGDRMSMAPLKTLEHLLAKSKIKVMVKEVGQGFGPKSLKALLGLPLEAIELGGFGGTNFVQIEDVRKAKAEQVQVTAKSLLTFVGNTNQKMISYLQEFDKNNQSEIKVKNIIVSGGIANALDGYYFLSLLNQSSFNVLYAFAQRLLPAARNPIGPAACVSYLKEEIELLQMCHQFLSLNESHHNHKQDHL